MAILSQRLILIFVFLNILIGVVTSIYQNPTISNGLVFAKGEIKNSLDTYSTASSTAFGDDSLYSGINNDNLVTDVTVGNPITLGVFIWKIFVNSLVPIPLPLIDDSSLTSVEILFIILISLVRTIFLILAGIELYLIIKNKKGT